MEPSGRLAPTEGDGGAPRLLVVFVIGTVVMVGAVVLIAWADSDWADAGGVAALLAVAGLILGEILRELRDDEDPS